MNIPKASLKFSAYAWAKLQFALKFTKNEVGFFGISTKENPLSIVDVHILPQIVSTGSVEFSEEDIANFYDECIDNKLNINQYSRVWIHTHPFGLVSPSFTDEKTFHDVFGNCDWAIMYILTKNNKDYCALQYNKTPSHRVELTNTSVDFSIPFESSSFGEWEKELKEKVKEKVFVQIKKQKHIDKTPQLKGIAKDKRHFNRKFSNSFEKELNCNAIEEKLSSSFYDEEFNDPFYDEEFDDSFFEKEFNDCSIKIL